MKSATLGVGLCVFAACLCLGQTPAAPAFDVASVKATELSRAGGEGSKRQSVNTSPGSLIMRNFSLKSCVQWAYNLKDYQVSGPGWIESERYDIVAKAADPVKDDELRRMLQALLADRFKLVCHRETKELPVYALGIAKEGLKMKPSVGEGESNFKPAKGLNRFSLVMEHTSMPQFADLLSQPLQRPVVDQTGLTGGFDFTLDLAKYLGMDMSQGPRPEGDGMTKPVGLSTIEGAVIMALREQLGLKLESKKSPIDMVVVDKAEKVPTEN
jgi:uncharacterized protein (TIGR03435 family)